MTYRDFHHRKKAFIQRMAELEEKKRHHRNIVELTWIVPSILTKISRGDRLTEKELNLIKAFGIEVFDDE